MSDMGLAILGCGNHGERYLRHLTQGDVPGARAICIQRRDRAAGERLAALYSVEYVATIEDALEDPRVSACIVTSPPAQHLEALEIANALGVAVLCEKPLAANLDDLDRLRALADAPIMVAQTLRYQPTLLFARERRGALGEVHRQRWCQRLEPSDLAWQRDPEVAGGGSVLLTGVHLFDQIRWWWGRTPDTVTAEQMVVAGHPFENVFAATFRFEPEALLVSAEVTKCSTTRCGWSETVGRDGQMWVDYLEGRAREIRGRESRRLDAPADAPTLPTVLSDFLDFVRGERPNPIPMSDGIETLRMAEACYRSFREGRRVDLGEISPIVR
jgi:predicted dehydrogenase